MLYWANPLFGVTATISCAFVTPLGLAANKLTMLAQQLALCATLMLAGFGPKPNSGTTGALVLGVAATGAGVRVVTLLLVPILNYLLNYTAAVLLRYVVHYTGPTKMYKH